MKLAVTDNINTNISYSTFLYNEPKKTVEYFDRIKQLKQHYTKREIFSEPKLFHYLIQAKNQ